MPSFPSTAVASENVAVRFRELEFTAAVNRRWYGLPRGVYAGWTPSVTPGSRILTLGTDSRVGFSSLKVGSQSLPVQVDVFTKEAVTLNFTGHTQFPVYVIARADYQANSHTQARVLTRATDAVGPQEINICKVDLSGSDLVVDTTVPTNRHLPVAFDDQQFGFMLPGAKEDIVFAQTATVEVTLARTSLKTGSAPPGQLLADRLAIDLAADFLADQLGLRNVSLVGNAHTVGIGDDKINVGSSLIETSRQFAPLLDLEPGGDESTQGVITQPDLRNVCFVVNDITGHRPITASREPIHGRLESSLPILTAGTVAFDNASVNVQGTGTTFVSDGLQPGDTILADDGKYYAVDQVNGETDLDLVTAYQGADVTGYAFATGVVRRWELLFYSFDTGAEAAYTFTEAISARFFFPAWFRLDVPVFDAFLLMQRIGQRPVLPEATNTVAGRIKLAVAGSQAGAIFQVQDNLSAVGTNFHTLDFVAENAVIGPGGVESAGTGVANIIVEGDTGPNGAGAITGPQGPDGAPGKGLVALSEFFKDAGAGPGGTGHVATFDFSTAAPPLGGTLAHFVVGWARLESPGGWGLTAAHNIVSVIQSGPLIVDVTYDLEEPLGVAVSSGKIFCGASV